MRNAEQLHIILKKYNLAYPVPAEVQDYIEDDRKETLKAILKITGAAGVLFWLAVVCNMLFKKLGISLSILQSKIIVGVSIVAIAGGSSTGTYHAAKYVYKKIKVPAAEEKIKESQIEDTLEKKVDSDAMEKNVDSAKAPPAHKPAGGVKYRIGVQPFRGMDIDKSVMISDKIASYIEATRGKDNVVNMRIGRDKNVNLMVMGSLTRFGESYTINAKLIDVESGKLITVITENIISIENIDDTCRKIAENILKKANR